MKPEAFLGIDTSNYTTSMALCDAEGRVIENRKLPLPVKTGERGLRQSEAVFAHVKNLPVLCRELRERLAEYDIRAIGCSARPRDGEDSYMPCFLSGVAVAEAMAAALDVPLFRFSHQNGHIMAALYAAGVDFVVEKRPFVAFHVSGGTTEMLYVIPDGRRLTVSLIGESADLHAGQAVDRIGVSLGLSFPCGPAMEALARQNTKPVPPCRISVHEGVCHLSGLENLAQKLYRDTDDKALVCDYVFHFLANTLCEMARAARRTYSDAPLVFAGGVMSNGIVKDILAERLPSVYFAGSAFSADNAAGTALLTRRAYFEEKER